MYLGTHLPLSDLEVRATHELGTGMLVTRTEEGTDERNRNKYGFSIRPRIPGKVVFQVASKKTIAEGAASIVEDVEVTVIAKPAIRFDVSEIPTTSDLGNYLVKFLPETVLSKNF
jgi:hypothetical protein